MGCPYSDHLDLTLYLLTASLVFLTLFKDHNSEILLTQPRTEEGCPIASQMTKIRNNPVLFSFLSIVVGF